MSCLFQKHILLTNKKPPDGSGGKRILLTGESGLVTFRRWDDHTTDLDSAAFSNISDKTSTVEEGFLKASLLAHQPTWATAGLIVFYAKKRDVTDGKFLTDKRHEFYSVGNDISAAMLKFEAATLKKYTIDQSYGPISRPTFIEASVTSAVSISLETGTGDGLNFLDKLHRLSSSRGNTNRYNTSTWCVEHIFKGLLNLEPFQFLELILLTKSSLSIASYFH